MQFTATRDDRQHYTLRQALTSNRASDGSFYVPVTLPVLSPEEISLLKEKSFGQCTAQILNLLFETEISGWDVDFCIGRNPVRLSTVGHRMLVGECWHNPEETYDYLVRKLSTLLGVADNDSSSWLKIVCRIAVLFGIYGQLSRNGVDCYDIAVLCSDFSMPISVWYARKMGLPVENIICCCNENHPLWDLICHGQLRTNTLSIPTSIPESDIIIPDELERLVFECGGSGEVLRYVEVCNQGGLYIPDSSLLQKLQKGLSVSVVSSQRVKDTIRDVWRAHGHLLSPACALSYAGAMDYRVKNGAIKAILILSEHNALQDAKEIAEALQTSENTLKKYLQ